MPNFLLTQRTGLVKLGLTSFPPVPSAYDSNEKKGGDDVDYILSKMGVEAEKVDTSSTSDTGWEVFTVLTDTLWKKGIWALLVLILFGSLLPKSEEASTISSSSSSTSTEIVKEVPAAGGGMFAEPTARLSDGNLPSGFALFTSYKTFNKTETFTVNTSVRTNNNNHKVLDVKYSDGYNASYVFWKNGSVEIFTKLGNGKLDMTPGTWKYAHSATIITSKMGSVTSFGGTNPKEFLN